MRYFKMIDEGCNEEWGGNPTYWLEVNEDGDAVRQLEKYPNGNVVSYDKTHIVDIHGALAVMVVDGDDAFWTPSEITQDEFEREWRAHVPMNRPS